MVFDTPDTLDPHTATTMAQNLVKGLGPARITVLVEGRAVQLELKPSLIWSAAAWTVEDPLEPQVW